MKANELMIGDWVKTNDLYKAIKDVKVRAISQYSIEDETTNQWVECQHIEPIPLTAEILEKNGFVEHRQFATFTEYWFDTPKEWVRIAPNTYIEIYNGENRNVHIDGKVYVHELQHALRLCGIDKEIVL